MDTSPSPEQVYDLEKVYVLVTAIPYFILVWDWLANISKEYALFFKNTSTSHGHGIGGNNNGIAGIFSIKNAFIASRYITLAWCTFVVVILGNVGSHPNLCSWAKYFPYGYSTTMLSAHLVMVLRMYSIYERRRKILIFLLVLAGVDYALQMAANHASTAIYARSENPGLAVCFLVPTSLLYALVFISPTIFHHIVLAMTLFKSIQHIRATRAGGIKSIMHIVQRDQILFVLAICLINFANLVLVLQRSSWPYRLINQLPAAAFTQIFLSRIIFNLKHVQKKLASASVSPVITTLALSPSSRRGDFMFGNGSVNDLELGEDTKSPSSAAFNTHELKNNKKDFEAGSKKNVFTLKFDPTSRRSGGGGGGIAPSYRTHNSAPTSPALGKDAFQVKEAKFELHNLSSYRLPSPNTLESDISDPPYFSTPSKITNTNANRNPLDGDPPSPSSNAPASSPGPSSPNTSLPAYTHQRESSSRKMELSTYFEMVRESTAGTETPSIQPVEPQMTVQTNVEKKENVSDEAPSPLTKPAAEEGGPRTSLETLKSRASTIDDQQRSMDWEPPTAWGTSASPRASPIPFSERRLSTSVARNSLSTQRSRHASSGQVARGNRPSFEGSISNQPGASAGSSTGTRAQGQHRGSACYASIFSFENEDNLEDAEDEEIKPLPPKIDEH